MYSKAEKMKRVIIVNYATEVEHWKPSLLFKVEAKLEKPAYYLMYSKALSNFLLNKNHMSQSFCTSTFQNILSICPSCPQISLPLDAATFCDMSIASVLI